MRAPLQLLRRPRPTPMTLGDMLYRLSLVSPDDFKAFDGLIRWRYRQVWPSEDDPLRLVRTGTDHP